MSDIPRCNGCGGPLDRIDHYGIEHTIIDNDNTIYRPVSVMDGGPLNESYGLASEVDLRCGRCGTSIPIEARRYFYERWVYATEAIAQMGTSEKINE